jgi:hypothetical protein
MFKDPLWWLAFAGALVIFFCVVDFVHHRVVNRPKDTVPQELDDFRQWRADEVDEVWD